MERRRANPGKAPASEASAQRSFEPELLNEDGELGSLPPLRFRSALVHPVSSAPSGEETAHLANEVFHPKRL